MAKSPAGKILIGPAGWSYADWEGIVYPHKKPHGFHPAAYLAQFFDTIEINTSFYNPIRPEVAASWVDKVHHNPAFQFSAKLWKRFTHDRDASLEDEKVCKKGFEPLAAAGRLGAVLLQFPWSFKNTKENHEYMSGLCVQFAEFPLVVEVRHSSWNQPEVLARLREQGVGFCNIDQPHGRNYEHWFTANEHPQERYNYLYTMEELKPWAERISNVAKASEVVFVVTNNHFEGKAIANAFQLTSLLRGEPLNIPASIVQHYPQLLEVAAQPNESAEPLQSDLAFGSSEAVK